MDELEEDTLVVIVQWPNDRIVGNLPTEWEHAVDLPLPEGNWSSLPVKGLLNDENVRQMEKQVLLSVGESPRSISRMTEMCRRGRNVYQ
jgi:hypothetical protein